MIFGIVLASIMICLFKQDCIKEENTKLEKVSIEEIMELQRIETEEFRSKQSIKQKILGEKGLIFNTDSIQDYDS